jgi:two-component system chemotaxis response regulator CheB
VATRNIIVIGASAGGFAAIREITSGLPTDINASILIVWHISPDVRGFLPQILNQNGKLHAANAMDSEILKPGHIYVAPPDHHLLIDQDVIRLSRGPKENRFRPAIDPLFRSAAYFHGHRVIGVILSGALDDGAAGIWTIKQHGGIAVVQDPSEAEVESMPRNAIEAVRVDHVARVSEMAALLVKLTKEEVQESNTDAGRSETTQLEIDVAMENEKTKYKILRSGELSPYTCPECHGVLVSIIEGKQKRFRCHTGHAFSANSLLASISGNIEESLWIAVRSIQESVLLLNHMGDHFAEANQPKVAAMYFKKAQEAEKRIAAIELVMSDHEMLSLDVITSQVEDGRNGNPEV